MIATAGRTQTRSDTLRHAQTHSDAPDALPVLEICREEISARTGRAVAVTVTVIPGDRVELVTRLRRAPSARWRDRPADD